MARVRNPAADRRAPTWRRSAAPHRGASAAMKASANEKRVELLFEVGCEEIPAGATEGQEELRHQHRETSRRRKSFDGYRWRPSARPAPDRLGRRTARQAGDVETEVTGPPKSVAYDSVGAPTRAAQSFAEKQRVHVNDLT